MDTSNLSVRPRDLVETILEAHRLWVDGCRERRKLKEIAKTLGISAPTLSKYLTIYDGLHRDLVPYLGRKGKDKLSLGLAMKLVSDVWNPLYQYEIFPTLNAMKNKDALAALEDETQCLICCASTNVMEQMPCCNQFYCIDCVKRTFESAINAPAFTGIKCPFCHMYFTEDYVKWFLYTMEKSYRAIASAGKHALEGPTEWRNKRRFRLRQRGNDTFIYTHNLYKKYDSMMNCIIDLYRKANDPENIGSYTFQTIFGPTSKVYYGPCSRCTPGVSEVQRQNNFGHLNICTVEKQCANGEGDVAVLDEDMFVCIVCKSLEENYEDGTFKKCPHCGIKTLKPEGCNYVKCGDHRWCFICNERLEMSHDGHNTHYYTGPGTSAYSSQCRESLNTDTPKFILNTCSCSDCAPHNGAPLCRELECMERCQTSANGFMKYCESCSMTRIRAGM